MANKLMKVCSVSLVNRELQIKTLKYHFTPTSLAKMFQSDITKSCRGCQARELLRAAIKVHIGTTTLKNCSAMLSKAANRHDLVQQLHTQVSARQFTFTQGDGYKKHQLQHCF